MVNSCTAYGSTPTSLTPDAIITSIGNIYNNGKEAGQTEGDLVWLKPAFSTSNQTAEAFPAQTISLNLSKYTHVLIHFKASGYFTRTMSYQYSKMFKIGDSATTVTMCYNETYRRTVQATSSGIIFSNGSMYNTSSAQYEANQYLVIPCEIYAFNFSTTKTLWTNPNPSTAFVPSTISLDLSSYKYVLVQSFYMYTKYTNTPNEYSEDCIKVEGNYTVGDYSANYKGVRDCTVKTTGVTFGSGGYNGPDFLLGNNNWAIPYRIIGIK